MSPSGLSACSRAPAPLPHGPDTGRRSSAAAGAVPPSLGPRARPATALPGAGVTLEAPPPAVQPPARRPARQGHRERRQRGARSSGTRAHRARPQRHRRYLARDGRRRRGTAALRLGLYGGGLGPFRRCPQPPSAVSGASFGNLRRGQSALGNLRNDPLRVFPASYRRTMTRAISAASPQPFRPPSHALPFPRQFPSLSASFFAQLRQLPPCQRGGVWRRCNVTKPL